MIAGPFVALLTLVRVIGTRLFVASAVLPASATAEKQLRGTPAMAAGVTSLWGAS